MIAPWTSGSNKSSEKWSNSADNLQKELTVFANKLDVAYEKEEYYDWSGPEQLERRTGSQLKWREWGFKRDASEKSFKYIKFEIAMRHLSRKLLSSQKYYLRVSKRDMIG